MDRFVRGARVKPPPETPITLNQAAFVCCDIASKQGMTEAQFLTHMMRAWMAMVIVNLTSSDAAVNDVPQKGTDQEGRL